MRKRNQESNHIYNCSKENKIYFVVQVYYWVLVFLVIKINCKCSLVNLDPYRDFLCFTYENGLVEDRFFQILISVHKNTILIEHIHHLEIIYSILLDSSLNMCLLACQCMQINYFQLKVKLEALQLNKEKDFEIWQVTLYLHQGP